jgi:hypothetical protein
MTDRTMTRRMTSRGRGIGDITSTRVVARSTTCLARMTVACTTVPALHVATEVEVAIDGNKSLYLVFVGVVFFLSILDCF